INIKKNITLEDLSQQKLMILYFKTFEYILPYWKLNMAKSLENRCVTCICVWDVKKENAPKKYEGTLDAAKSLENGCNVPFNVWDVTEENIPKKYEGGSVFLRKLHIDDFYLSCIKLFNSRGLSVDRLKSQATQMFVQLIILNTTEALLPPHTDESKKVLAEDIGKDRLYAVDAYIMKKQKVLPHHEQLSRMFDMEAIKQWTEAFII
ncbi:hypothetical protein MTR67_024427, partial [Solanum verrucosum]